MHIFAGTPERIGRNYGAAFKDNIHYNIRTLLGHEGLRQIREQSAFRRFVAAQEQLLAERWPWLLAEMKAVAEGAGAACGDILQLNLRAWQFAHYWSDDTADDVKPDETGGCSCIAVRLQDGSLANAGALDDPIEFYCGPVKVVPDSGFRFISFPIAGTSWANRGMNSGGLSVGISSQLLPGLRREAGALNQDIALRIIMQTLRTVAEVRDFCREHPFTMNLVCVDAQGEIFCAHQTAAGLLEIPAAEGYAVLTNHVADDRHLYTLAGQGVKQFPEALSSRPRRGNLLRFAKERGGACTPEELMELIDRTDPDDPGAIHNKGTIYLTYCSPMERPPTLWIKQTAEGERDGSFLPNLI